MNPTRNGDLLALKIARDTDDSIAHLRATCAAINSAAAAFTGLAVLGCNRDLTEAEAKRYDQLGRKLAKLAAELGDGWGVDLTGDPRGCVVKLTNPQHRSAYDSFGGDGVIVPSACAS